MNYRSLILRIVLLVGLVALIGCGRLLLRDPSFDVWCGDALCLPWEADGEVTRVGTWRKTDYGVALGDGATLSQVFDGEPVACVELEVIADVDARANVWLQMDFLDDGSIDYEQPIPESSWARLEFLIPMPTWYDKARLLLHKRGHGRAVLAQIKATESSGCSGPALELVDVRLGANCKEGDHCESGLCANAPRLGFWLWGSDRVCSQCEADDDCEEGELCGGLVDDGAVYRACQPQRARPLGDVCDVDDVCESGVCCGQRCSECCADAADVCAGRSCVEYTDEDPPGFAPLFLCDRSESPGAPGAACVVDADCSARDCDRPAAECLASCEDSADQCEDLEFTCLWSVQLAGTCR